MIFKKSKGFTLIEILIVITIIGMMMALALVGLAGAQKNARDTTRKSNLEQYRNALQAWSGNNNGEFPGFAATTAMLISTSNLCTSTLLFPFLEDTCLTDPKAIGVCGDSDSVNPGRRYCYLENGSGTANATNYVLYGGLEGGNWWEICSNGKAGKVTVLPDNSTCDL